MHFKHYENPYSGLAQYVNCAAANSGADAGMYDASSEIYKLSTWQHVPHRGNPFRDKGGLRGQRQSGSCSKRHHVTREEDFSGGSGFLRPSTTAQVFLNQREYTTHSSLPPFSRRKPPKREQEPRDPPPPRPRPPPLVLSEPESELSQTWRQTLKNSPRQNTSSGKKTTRIGHHF